MPAPPLSNTNEGGTDGVTITTGNSGGASGDAWSAITNPSATLQFNSTHPRGTLDTKVITQAVSAADPIVKWTGLGAGTSPLYMRVYIWIDTDPTNNGANSFKFMGVWTSAAVQSALLKLIDAGRTIKVEDAAGATPTGQTGGIAMDLGKWIRVEAKVISNTGGAGSVEWRLYNQPDEQNLPSDSRLVSGLTLGANSDQAWFGIVATSAPTSYTYYMDDFALSTADWIGPVAAVSYLARRMPLGV